MVAVLKDAEPFAFEGGDIGVLVVHGFTGSTQSMRYLGEGLHRRFGFTVVGPRLPGHGTSPDDMETTGYLDWMGEAERALSELAKRKNKVFVTGLSMGGTLTSEPRRALSGSRDGDRAGRGSGRPPERRLRRRARA